MKAVELSGYEGFQSLRAIEVETPKPRDQEILIEVRASGIAAKVGSQVRNQKVGDRVTSIVSSGSGPKESPSVLLLHGFSNSSHGFRNLVPPLRD